MFRLFNMLLQNLTNSGADFKEVSYIETVVSFKFTDKDGNKYTCWVRKED